MQHLAGHGDADQLITVSDPSAVELGLRWRPLISGFVTGVRFYKSPLNTGLHTGSLWTNSGALWRP